MTTPTPCIPDPCTYFTYCATCVSLTEAPLKGKNLYGLGAAAYAAAPVILGDLPAVTQTELSGLFVRTSLAQFVPWVIVLITLAVMFIYARIISFAAGVLLLLVIIVVAVVGLSWIVHDSESVVHRLQEQYRTSITNNIANNETYLTNLFFDSWLGSNYCSTCCAGSGSPNTCRNEVSAA